MLSNHTIYDGSKTKLPAVQARKPGEPHPYVVGTDSVARYLTTVGECAQAAIAGLPDSRRRSGPGNVSRFGVQPF